MKRRTLWVFIDYLDLVLDIWIYYWKFSFLPGTRKASTLQSVFGLSIKLLIPGSLGLVLQEWILCFLTWNEILILYTRLTCVNPFHPFVTGKNSNHYTT
jgi:hypothetical protein